MKVAVGGTFDRFHLGHKELLKKAFEIGDFVLIGITSDEFARREGKGVEPYEERKRRVEEWIRENFEKEYEISPLNDRYGKAVEDPELDAIVVSPETEPVAREINEVRKEKGMKELKIFKIPLILAEDFLPICSSRIRRGEISPEGIRLKPLKVGIGTQNPSKYLAVQDYFLKVMKCEMEFYRYKVPGVPEQPFEEETYRGAFLRAKYSLENSGGDYGVGIESGIFKFSFEGRQVFVVGQVACVLDKRGLATFGTSSKFQLPEEMVREILKKGSLGKVASEISGDPEINKKGGFVGYLSKGEVLRYDLSYEAVRNAFMPRKRREIYYLEEKLRKVRNLKLP